MALVQREAMARLGMMSERSFEVLHLARLEEYNRSVMLWNIELVMRRQPTNLLAVYHGGVREREGQSRMLHALLDVPTPDGQTVRAILAPEQRADFDRAFALSERLIEEARLFCVPLMQLVRMETDARRQESRCYDAWVASMEHLGTLIDMSAARRCSLAAQRSLSTETRLDAKISAVAAALKRAAAAQSNGGAAAIAAEESIVLL